MSDNKKSAKQSAYVDKLEAQLDEWSAQVDLFEARAKQARAEARIRYEKMAEELADRRREATGKLKELNRANAENWESFKEDLEKSWKAFGETIDKVKSKFD